jgi:hypothetical protein
MTGRCSNPRALLHSEGVLKPILSVGLALAAGISLLSVVLLAIAHLSDRYNVNHVSGSWMALAQAARSGTLYPPLFEHGFYGGTRFMPLPILVHAGVASITGEYLVSGKISALLTAVPLFALTFIVLRRLGCSRLISLGLLGAVAVTPTSLLAITSIRGDTLSVIAQVAAIAIVAYSIPRRTAAAAAAVLCAVAIFSKLSGVWALAAILIWFLLHERSRLPLFAGVFLSSVAALFAMFEALSGGRMAKNVQAFAFAGTPGDSPLSGVGRLLDLLVSRAGAVWLIFPLAVLAVLKSFGRREPTIFQLAFVAEVVILAVVFRDRGTDFNHLIDLTILTALVVGEFVVSTASPGRELSALSALVAIAVVLGTAQSYRESVKPGIGQAVRELFGGRAGAFSTQPLSGYVRRRDSILSEDPTIPVLLGRPPVVLDAFMLLRMQSSHPPWVGHLRDRIDARRFRRVVLLVPIENSEWFARSHFGTTVSEAIRENYRLATKVEASPESYWVYVPRGAAG